MHVREKLLLMLLADTFCAPTLGSMSKRELLAATMLLTINVLAEQLRKLKHMVKTLRYPARLVYVLVSFPICSADTLISGSLVADKPNPGHDS